MDFPHFVLIVMKSMIEKIELSPIYQNTMSLKDITEEYLVKTLPKHILESLCKKYIKSQEQEYHVVCIAGICGIIDNDEMDEEQESVDNFIEFLEAVDKEFPDIFEEIDDPNHDGDEVAHTRKKTNIIHHGNITLGKKHYHYAGTIINSISDGALIKEMAELFEVENFLRPLGPVKIGDVIVFDHENVRVCYLNKTLDSLRIDEACDVDIKIITE